MLIADKTLHCFSGVSDLEDIQRSQRFSPCFPHLNLHVGQTKYNYLIAFLFGITDVTQIGPKLRLSGTFEEIYSAL